MQLIERFDNKYLPTYSFCRIFYMIASHRKSTQNLGANLTLIGLISGFINYNPFLDLLPLGLCNLI